jgi:hypothetical protein
VVEYVRALEVFVAPVEADRSLRRHIEGSIASRLRTVHTDVKALYPDDNYAAAGSGKMQIRLEMTTDAPIAGLDHVLDV